MPHVIVKLAKGRSEQQKLVLADALARAVTSTLQCSADSVSVAIEDVETAEWTQMVYVPDIQGKAGTIYKKPGYDPF
jgi:4-oxalocrotonate tautomerase